MQEEHEEDYRCTPHSILAAFESSEQRRPTSADAEMEVTAAYKWLIRMNLSSSVSIRRVLWLLTRGHDTVRTRDLMGVLVVLSKGDEVKSKLKTMLVRRCNLSLSLSLSLSLEYQ